MGSAALYCATKKPMDKKTIQKRAVKRPQDNGTHQIVQMGSSPGAGSSTGYGLGGLKTNTHILSEPLMDWQAYAKQVETPGTIQRLMNSVDARFGGDPLYQKHRAVYQKLITSVAQATRERDGTPYTTGEAIRVVNEDLRNRKENARDLQRQKRGLPPIPGPGKQFTQDAKLKTYPVPVFRRADADHLTSKELRENGSGTLMDLYNQARAASRENDETVPGLRAKLPDKLRSAFGEVQDYSKVFAHQGDQIVPEFGPDAPGPVRMLGNVARQLIGVVNIPGALGGMTDLGDTVEEVAGAANRGDRETLEKIGHGLVGNDGWDAMGNLLGLFAAHKAPHLMSGATRGAALEIVGRTPLGSAVRNASSDARAAAIVSKATGLPAEHAGNLTQAIREHFAEPPQVRYGNPVEKRSTISSPGGFSERSRVKGKGLSHEQRFEIEVGRAVKAGVATERQAQAVLEKWRATAKEWMRKNRGGTRDQFYERFSPKLALDRAIPHGALNQDGGVFHVPFETRPSFELAPEMANLGVSKQRALRDATLDYLRSGIPTIYDALGIPNRFGAGRGSFEGRISPNIVLDLPGANSRLAKAVAALEGALGLQDGAVTMRNAKPGSYPGVRLFDPNGKAIPARTLKDLFDTINLETGADFTELSPQAGVVFGKFNDMPLRDFNRIIKEEAAKHGLSAEAGGYAGSYIERENPNGTSTTERELGGYGEHLQRIRHGYIRSKGNGPIVSRSLDDYARARESAGRRVGGSAFTTRTGARFAEANRFVKENLGLAQEANGGVKGAVILREGAKPVMHLFTGTSDISTLLHESGHLWRQALPTNENALLAKAFGAKIGSVEFEEGFARGLERYMYDGRAPSKATRPIFARFKGWLQDIYGDVKSSPLHENVHPDLRGVLDRMFGYERPRSGLGSLPVPSRREDQSRRQAAR